MSCAKSNPNRGSTLLLVIIVFALLLVFGMAAITLSSNAHKNAVTDYQTQQAYFTARSAVLAAVDYVKNDSDPKALLEKLAALGTSDKTVDAQLGEYDLTVTKLDDTHYQIASLANADGVERAFYTILELNAASPFEGLATLTKGNNAPSSFSNVGTYIGDIFLMQKGSQPVTVGNIGDLKGNLIIDGDATIGNGQLKVSKTKNAKGEEVGGNIYVNGKATFSSCQINGIAGSFYAWGGANFFSLTGDSHNPSMITGNNYVNGPVSGTPIGKKAVQPIPSDVTFPKVQMTQDEIDAISTTPGAGISFESAATSSKILKQPGKITIRGNIEFAPSSMSSMTSYLQNYSNAAVIFDTDAAGGDIHIKLPAGTYNFEHTKNMRVEGSHKVYVYCIGVVNINIKNGAKCGDTSGIDFDFDTGDSSWNPDLSTATPPKMTILASAECKVDVRDSGATLCAYVFMPKSTVTLTNNANFAGSLIVSTLESSTQCHLAFIKPKDSGLPGGGGGGGGSGGITVVGNYSGKPKSGAS